jgi:hypothetical protein
MGTKTKIIKSSCLSLVCFLLAILFWYLLRKSFLWQEGRVLLDFIYVFISFSILIIFSLVYLTLIDNRKIVYLTSFFITFSFLAFFLREDGMWVDKVAIICYVIVIFILFVIFNTTNKNLIYERKNSVIFHPGKSILRAAPAIMVVFAILLSVIFYFNFPLVDREGNIEVKEEYIEKASKPFEGLINKYIPIYDLDMTVDEFIVLSTFLGLPFAQGEEEIKPPVDIEKPPEEIIRYLKDKGIYNLEEINFMEHLREDEEFRNLFIEEVKKIAVDANPYLMDKYQQNIAKNWGVELDGEDKMGEVFTRLINNKINEVPKRIRDLFLIFPVASLFGILQVTFIILGFVYSFICWILIIIFKKAKFYHYRKVKVEKEEIEL